MWCYVSVYLIVCQILTSWLRVCDWCLCYYHIELSENIELHLNDCDSNQNIAKRGS